MNDQSKSFFLGIFIIVALGLLTWLVFFLKPGIGNGETTLRVHFSNIDRIIKGTRVTYAGKPVGEVYEIREIPNPRKAQADESGNLYVYELVLKIDSSVNVYSYDEILFSTSGLLGEKSIAIVPKIPPLGGPSAVNVTNEVLYGRSTDKLEDALERMTELAGTFENTMGKIHVFLDENEKDFQMALREMKTFLSRANETDAIGKAAEAFSSLDSTLKKTDVLITEAVNAHIVEKMDKSFSNFQLLTNRIEQGEGTLGRLLNSDSLYLQLGAVMTKLETVLNDIRNYGLLFQYDKTWKRKRIARQNTMCSLQTPCDFYRYFDQEILSIDVSLSRTSELLSTLQCKEIPIQSECFAQSFLELLGKVDHLRNSLKLYTEMLMSDYCQKCTCD